MGEPSVSFRQSNFFLKCFWTFIYWKKIFNVTVGLAVAHSHKPILRKISIVVLQTARDIFTPSALIVYTSLE